MLISDSQLMTVTKLYSGFSFINSRTEKEREREKLQVLFITIGQREQNLCEYNYVTPLKGVTGYVR